MSKIFSISLLCLLPGIYFSQTTGDFAWPIDTPHVITGNYGELRPNHFHMGWDFSTNGKINFPVYAIADGYVSRIKVSSVGYGKAVYIDHPGNKVSLYAHLTSYTGAISAFVKQEQGAKQSYEIELFPAKDELRVTKGELIGYSGNSGSSSGPHLHFEIRNRQTEVPLNLAEFYNLDDTIKPTIQQVGFYDLADTIRPILKNTYKIKTSKKDSLFIQKDSIVLNHSVLGFAFAGFDRFVDKGNPNVIHSAKLFVDDQLIFTYILDNISFDEQRYVNEFSEIVNKIKYQKCFLPTLYPVSIYENCANKGRIVLTDTVFHLLKLKVNDEHNNEKILEFYFKTMKINSFVDGSIKGDLFVDCARDFKSNKKNLQISIPAKTFYYSTPLLIENTLKTDGKLYVIPASINFKSPVKIGFQVPEKLLLKKSRLVFKNGSVVYTPVNVADSVNYSVYSFGHFQLEQDTVAPKIKTQLSPKKIKRIKNFESFSFLIRDNLSGLSKYHLYLNDVWVLAEYDAKSGLLTYFFDSETPAGNLKFRVETEDKVGNHSEFKFILKRK